MVETIQGTGAGGEGGRTAVGGEEGWIARATLRVLGVLGKALVPAYPVGGFGDPLLDAWFLALPSSVHASGVDR